MTVCYSTHRPETLELTSEAMKGHDAIILEEPPHPDFQAMLGGKLSIDEHLLSLDIEYPEFSKSQYQHLQKLFNEGKKILQIEPYFEHLYTVQLFFADGHSPEEIKTGTVLSTVYQAEREATKRLLDYYKAFRGNDFSFVLETMNSFAMADAARFILRDQLRVEGMVEAVAAENSVYIEAGSIHLSLFKLLKSRLPAEWKLKFYSVDRQLTQQLGAKDSLFSPGDILTLHYIFGRKPHKKLWQLYCARALIYNKIVVKEEMPGQPSSLPHTLSELYAISTANKLTFEQCALLYQKIRSLPTDEAQDLVKKSLPAE